MQPTFIPVGFTKKTHGIGGELKMAVAQEYLEEFLKTKVIYIEDKSGKALPFFIISVRGSAQEFIVKLEDCDSREAAQALSSKKILLNEKNIALKKVKAHQAKLDFNNCQGYQIEDSVLGQIGKIESIIQYQAQVMAMLYYNNKEVMIPLNTNFVTKLDTAKRIIHTTLPEGILSI